jgi:hypothetical protein
MQIIANKGDTSEAPLFFFFMKNHKSGSRPNLAAATQHCKGVLIINIIININITTREVREQYYQKKEEKKVII